MLGRLVRVLLLIAANGLAANAPRFALTFPGAIGATPTVDSGGNTYLTGSVVGNPFTATPGAFQPQNAGGTCYEGTGFGGLYMIPCSNAFVIKLNPLGAVVFATYLGGSDAAAGSAISVDSQGNVYVVGEVSKNDPNPPGGFPFTAGAAFTDSSGLNAYSFLAKLNATGTQLEYATLIPGADLGSIAVDGAGNLYFVGLGGDPGAAFNGQFPATPGAYQTAPASSTESAVVGKLNASGSALVYGTYLSGPGIHPGGGLAVDAAGNVLTTEIDFGTTYPNGGNAYLVQLNSAGSALNYTTLLGPAQAAAVKVVAGGGVYVQLFSSTENGNNSLVHVSADGSAVLSSISLPFGVYESGWDVDSAGNAYIVGHGSIQTSAGAFQPASGSGTGLTVAIVKLTADGQFAGATYLGASAAGSVAAIAAEGDGSVVVATSLVDFVGNPAPPEGDYIYTVANFFPAITLENSASYVASTVAPGELVSIRGYGMGPATGLASSPVTGLGGVQVYFDNLAAPITYAQAGQINVQAPWEIAGQTTTQVRILYNGVETGSTPVPVGAALPGVFYIENSDGSFNSPSNPARAGDYVSVYGTGAGAMSPPGVTGNSWPLGPLSSIAQPVSVTVGGEGAAVLYSGSAPTLDSGFFQINVRLPADLTATAQSLCVRIGGVMSAPAAISIH